MLKRYSALDSNYKPGKYYIEKKANIIFKEYSNLHLQQVACWSHTLSKMENFFQKEFNLDNSPSFNKGIIIKEFSLWRIEPLKWWIIEEDLTISSDLGTSLDMSHAFTCLHITGSHASILLNRYLPIDLRENMFPSASSASSAIHHVSIKLLKFSTNNYYLLLPRGFALSIWEMLLETSKQFGYEILKR